MIKHFLSHSMYTYVYISVSLSPLLSSLFSLLSSLFSLLSSLLSPLSYLLSLSNSMRHQHPMFSEQLYTHSRPNVANTLFCCSINTRPSCAAACTKYANCPCTRCSLTHKGAGPALRSAAIFHNRVKASEEHPAAVWMTNGEKASLLCNRSSHAAYIKRLVWLLRWTSRHARATFCGLYTTATSTTVLCPCLFVRIKFARFMRGSSGSAASSSACPCRVTRFTSQCNDDLLLSGDMPSRLRCYLSQSISYAMMSTLHRPITALLCMNPFHIKGLRADLVACPGHIVTHLSRSIYRKLITVAHCRPQRAIGHPLLSWLQ